VTTRDNLHIRPDFASKAVAARLASGLIVLRAFLRRLIILIALELEWGLVDKRGPMKRPHKRKSTSTSGFSLGGLEAPIASPWLNGGIQFTPKPKSDGIPMPVNLAKLYAKLDYLSKLAANPLAKAKRMAFHLARTYEGIIIAPKGPKRIAGRWGTQVRAYYRVLEVSIITQSRTRPPPLPPPRTCWPTITAF
jgi:hypothetical protein